MINTILLRRKLKVVVEAGNSTLSDTYLGAALKNLEGLGFTFSHKLIERVRTLSVDGFTELYNQLIADLKRMVGANVSYNPMYPNFPDQVMEMDICTLYLNAIFHYITLELPENEEKKRIPLLDNINLKIIDLGEMEDFNQIFVHILGSKSSLSETDKSELEWIVMNGRIEDIIPSDIPMKENVAFFAGLLLKNNKADLKYLYPFFRTATDVLRFAVALSEGDISLSSITKFRQFNRKERRLILALLENCANILEDMARYKNQWLRLGEKLHPTEERMPFPKCKEAFNTLRNTKKVKTVIAEVETLLLNGDIEEAVQLLTNRPGDFARKLDQLLRNTSNWAMVINKFSDVIKQVSSPVLLQVKTHFQHRNQSDLRSFFPKGNIAKAVVIDNTLPALDEHICNDVVTVCRSELVRRFSEMPSLGKVYLDERLKQYLVPFSQRSASKTLRTIVRGSQIDIPTGDTIRLFLWWKEGMVNNVPTGLVDIDLSALFFNEDWGYIDHISYTNLKTEYAYHSGDIRTAPEGAAEFIDFDMPSLLEIGCRYVMMSVHSFSEQPFCDLPECYAGWMIRQYPQSGEIFEAATVQDKIDLATNAQVCVPIVLDLVERKIIWADLALKENPLRYNNIEANYPGIISMGKAVTNMVKPSLYDLLVIHATARGTITEDIETAETIFSVEKGITPFDSEVIMANFL